MKTTDSADDHTLRTYVTGFVLSITLTLAAYILVQAHLTANKTVLSYGVVLGVIIAFALAQLVVQLYFFLHLGDEAKPRWRLLTLLLAIIIISIVVFGSIWIMSNLNYHMMSPSDQLKYIHHQGDL